MDVQLGPGYTRVCTWQSYFHFHFSEANWSQAVQGGGTEVLELLAGREPVQGGGTEVLESFSDLN